MKRFLLVSLLALGGAVVAESSASAQLIPKGIGANPGHIGRVRGYWLNPTRGPLYDYSSYFATLYPYMPGAQEYQWQPTGQYGAFGTGVAVLPTSPPPVRQAPPATTSAPPIAPAKPTGSVPATPLTPRR